MLNEKFVIVLICYLFCYINKGACDCDGGLLNPNLPKKITNEISFLYFHGPTVNDYHITSYENGLTLTNHERFNSQLNTVFYFPGWTEKPTNHEHTIDTIAAAFLTRRDVNFIVLDYSNLLKDGSAIDYASAAINTTKIGEALAYFFRCYIPAQQPIEKLHLIGHSLGAQVVSRTANSYGAGKFYWLTGLDPAGPIFTFIMIPHLTSKDGKFVDVIHTDANNAGDGRVIGHVDFYPNMGTRFQPGCPTNGSYEFCSHHRSVIFYAESVRKKNSFPSQYCKLNFFCSQASKCCKQDAVINYMGYDVNKTLLGTFYLKTNSTCPYDLEEKGFYV